MSVRDTLERRTEAHYDAHPFIEGGNNRVRWWRNYLSEFLPDDLVRERLVLDVGSSVGEISRGLLDRGARLACLDVSLGSLVQCRELNPEAVIYHASALELPFANGSFDHVISIGVLHHTPNCRRGFREAVRTVGSGGRLVVFLYNYWNIYHLIYRAFGPIRQRVSLQSVPGWILYSLQPFVRSHLHQRLDKEQLRNLLGDKLWTPQATFHSARELRRWGKEEGVELLQRKQFYLGYANVFVFRKPGTLPPPGRTMVKMKCIRCSSLRIRGTEARLECEACGHSYERTNGVVHCLIS
jgi:SAM-dependent methyltransferase